MCNRWILSAVITITNSNPEDLHTKYKYNHGQTAKRTKKQSNSSWKNDRFKDTERSKRLLASLKEFTDDNKLYVRWKMIPGIDIDASIENDDDNLLKE